MPVAAEEIHQLADFAADLKIDLTVVGPELPLSLGIADEFARRGLPLFGPSRQAAELEASKVFAKQFMERHGIPTAPFAVIHDAAEGRAAAERFGYPLVLKADGLAAGKGVVIAADGDELEAALEAFFVERRFGAAADRVVVEEFLRGEEVSFIALSDGERLLPFATSKDYKRIGEGDTRAQHRRHGRPQPVGGAVVGGLGRDHGDGDATGDRRHGGGGAPARRRPLRRPDGDRRRGRGCSSSTSASAIPRRRRCCCASRTTCCRCSPRGRPGRSPPGGCASARRWGCASSSPAATTRGRRSRARRSRASTSPPPIPGVEIFHAGTVEQDGRVLTDGGRVLNVCATGRDLVAALRRAYAAAGEIDWPHRVLRRDIGRRVLERARTRGLSGWVGLTPPAGGCHTR